MNKSKPFIIRFLSIQAWFHILRKKKKKKQIRRELYRRLYTNLTVKINQSKPKSKHERIKREKNFQFNHLSYPMPSHVLVKWCLTVLQLTLLTSALSLVYIHSRPTLMFIFSEKVNNITQTRTEWYLKEIHYDRSSLSWNLGMMI